MDRHIAGIMLAAGGGILIGVAAAWGEASRRSQLFFGERYSEEVASYDRAFQAARAGGAFVEEPAGDVEDLGVPIEIAITNPVIAPDYLAMSRAYGNSVESSSSVLTMEFIDEDVYAEEDGRAKEQILIHMGEREPLFISEGVVIPNWSELVGPNILVDIYQKCPPGTDQVVYVRNHQTDTDYEIIQELP